MSEPVPPSPPERAPERVPEPSQPPKKPRSPIERAVVWSVIAILLGVMSVEAWAHWNFKRAYEPLLEKIRLADDSDAEVTGADVRAAVRGKRPENTQRFTGITKTSNLEETYVWHGILKDRTMYVYYGVGDDPTVLSVSTEQDPPPAPLSEEMVRMFGVEQPTSEKVTPAAAEAQ